MSLTQMFLFGLTGIAFAIWTYLMFRTLFAQRRRAVLRTGKTLPGLRDAIVEWRNWLTAPEHSRDRWQLLAAMLVLLVLSLLNALL